MVAKRDQVDRIFILLRIRRIIPIRRLPRRRRHSRPLIVINRRRCRIGYLRIIIAIGVVTVTVITVGIIVVSPVSEIVGIAEAECKARVTSIPVSPSVAIPITAISATVAAAAVLP